jgi:hypothetical protein
MYYQFNMSHSSQNIFFSDRDHYAPSWLKSKDLREKSPHTPNLAYVKPTKDTSEVPQWKRKLKEKQNERIRVITKLPNSEQSSKWKVKTHKYINRQNQSTTGKL